MAYTNDGIFGVIIANGKAVEYCTENGFNNALAFQLDNPFPASIVSEAYLGNIRVVRVEM